MNCFNGEKFLEQAVKSVLNQTYQNWELIFWDNQSKDRTAHIFSEYSDPRLRYYLSPKHTLLYEARNYAMDRVAGEYLAFLDVDDLWAPNKLEKQIPLFDDAQVGIVCSNYWIKSERKRKQWKALRQQPPTGWVTDDLLNRYFVGLLTLVVRRSALTQLDRIFDPRYHIIGDFDLVVRLSTKWKLDYLNELVAFYRLHESNETSRHRERHIEELECWLRENRRIKYIRSCASLSCVRSQITYLKAMNHILKIGRAHV